MSNVTIPIIRYDGKIPSRLMDRLQMQDPEVMRTVREIIADVREGGDSAVLTYTNKLDKAAFASPDDMRVTEEEIANACKNADPELVETMRKAAANIRAYHELQVRKTWLSLKRDITLGQLIIPIPAVGIYVPGGTAGYPSTALMDMIPAKVAGVKRLVMVTPPGPDGGVSFPLSLVAASIAGVTEIYKVGGAQAIAALAFGTETVPKVDKIIGPGNAYVTYAKREVYGHVGIESVAGPSEVLIVADESANPRFVAADLLSQAEHDERAGVILVTPSEELARRVQTEVSKQLDALPRRDIAEKSVERYGTIIITESICEAMSVSNLIAPEHLELAVDNPFSLIGQVENAGAVFMGHYTPEPIGDYFVGTNHVLPTYGTARFSSPLSVDDFIKKTSIISYSQSALAEASADVIRFAESEGFNAHAAAISVRQ